MTSREELIAEARDAMIEHYVSSPGYDWNWHEMATIVLAVFEEAHTPTDEREALLSVLDSEAPPAKSCIVDGCRHFAGFQDSAGNEMCACHWSDALQSECEGQPAPLLPYRERVADAILAAGFRRSEVPEPSALINEGTDDAWQVIADALGKLGHDLNSHEDTAAWVQRYLFTSRPQGEPSDAQVRAALIAYWGGEKNTHLMGSMDGMRAALRAAGGCAMTESTPTTEEPEIVCPDCRDRKCGACIGEAYDFQKDEVTSCGCRCREGKGAGQ